MVIKTYTKGGITFQRNTYTGELKRIPTPRKQSVRDDPQEFRSGSSSSSNKKTSSSSGLTKKETINLSKLTIDANKGLSPVDRTILNNLKNKQAIFLRKNQAAARGFFTNPTYKRQSIDVSKLNDRTVRPIVKDGKIWGYYDSRDRKSVGFSKPISKKVYNERKSIVGLIS